MKIGCYRGAYEPTLTFETREPAEFKTLPQSRPRVAVSEIAARLLTFEDREVGRGASEAEIAAAEQALGIPIAGGYRQFLAQFGWGGVGHLELFGLGRDVPRHLDLVRLTRSERQKVEPRLKRTLLPVMNDGGGNLYCLDTDMGAEPSIVFWDHTAGPDQEPGIDADDFAQWLVEQLDDLE